VVFSSLGHLYIHLFTAIYFVIVLALERDWGLPYYELIELWTLGALLVGAAALPAGMLGDRLGASTMMVVFFIGMGGSSIAAGSADGPVSLMVALAGVGMFAAIYHPVGIPWLVHNSGPKLGRALGLNGIFGSLGAAAAGLVAGALIDAWGWRSAFWVPGALCLTTGVALLAIVLKGGTAGPRGVQAARRPGGTAVTMRRAFGLLMAAMFLAGMIYHSTQTSLPKLIETRHEGLVGEGALGVGALVALVYTVSGLIQVVGGYLADRYPLKPVYVGAVLLQVPMLWLAASAGGLGLVVLATLMVMAAVAALPAENMLLARYTPAHRHGLFFGLKFVLAFGAAPLSVELVALVTGRTGDFYWLYVLLALFALAAFTLALLLPAASAIARSPHPAS
jgi:MFS family permease